MRAQIVLNLLALALVGAAALAANDKETKPAAGGGEHKIVGEVMWVDAPGRTFAVKETLKSGARKEVAFVLAADGKVLIRGKAAGLEDVKAGDSVTVKYLERDGKNVASLCDVAKPKQKAS